MIAITLLAILSDTKLRKPDPRPTTVVSCVSVADHNNLVRANNRLTILASNLQESLNLQQQVLENVALRQETLEQSVRSLQPLTNLYVKLGEFEQILEEQRLALAGINGATNALSARLDGLQRAMIRLSQGFQEVQNIKMEDRSDPSTPGHLHSRRELQLKPTNVP